MLEILNPSLKKLTTLHLGGNAIAHLIIENQKDVEEVFDRAEKLGGEIYPFGLGSNILADDGELPYVLVSLDLKKEIEILGEENGKIMVRASADVSLPKLLRFCVKNELSGLESLVGIPGSVGGAVFMNAGSFGTEIGEKIEQIKIVTDKKIESISKESLDFSYRSLKIFEKKLKFIVFEAIFALTYVKRHDITKRMSHDFFEKKSRQPITAWSAGCVFKNPAPDMTAGRLLDMAGLKGQELGGMAFSNLHANFLINKGHGTSSEAFQLIEMAKDKIVKDFGITLNPEVRIMLCHKG